MARQPLRNKMGTFDPKTREEIDRQYTLLSADLDKRALKGNAKMEDGRHHRKFTGLKKNERRECFQIRLQRNEILDDLRKVRRGYTGHYDESKSPIENIQCALRHQCQTPLRSSRLHVPNSHPIRKAKSVESIPVQRATSPSKGGFATRPMTIQSSRKPSSNTAKARRPKLEA